MTFPVPTRRRIPTWAWIVLAACAAALIAVIVFAVLMVTNKDSAPPRAGDVARQVGCGPITYDTAPLELYIKEGLTCRLGANDAHIVTFATRDNRDNYLKVAKTVGGNFVVGDGYIISVVSPDTAQVVARQLGATVG